MMRKIATMENGNFLVEMSPDEFKSIGKEPIKPGVYKIPIDDKAKEFLYRFKASHVKVINPIINSAMWGTITKQFLKEITKPDIVTMTTLTEIANGEWQVRNLGVELRSKLAELLRSA